ncbi:hypothetical protein ACFL6Y_10500 [Elusimicrobiota bacterium]
MRTRTNLTKRISSLTLVVTVVCGFNVNAVDNLSQLKGLQALNAKFDLKIENGKIKFSRGNDYGPIYDGDRAAKRKIAGTVGAASIASGYALKPLLMSKGQALAQVPKSSFSGMGAGNIRGLLGGAAGLSAGLAGVITDWKTGGGTKGLLAGTLSGAALLGSIGAAEAWMVNMPLRNAAMSVSKHSLFGGLVAVTTILAMRLMTKSIEQDSLPKP